MIESIKEFFGTAPFIAWSVLGVLIAMVFIAAMWDMVKWWWMNTWMSFPIIGKIARLSKDTNADPKNEVWLKSERNLCNEYKQYVRVMDEHDYHEKADYIVFAGDNGRSSMPGLLWPIIIGMVFIEAMGFSYVLAGFTIPGASENVQQVGAYGIAFLISGLLIFLTHFSGHELYKNKLINDSRQKWIQDGRSHKLETGTVSLKKPQSTDGGQPDYTRRINRIGTSVAGYGVSVGTVIFIIIIAFGATYVRGQVLEKMIQDEVTGKTEQVQATNAVSSDGLDMASDITLPAADRENDQEALMKVANDGASTERHGGWGTFIILAVIFIALQVLGIFFGFNWGFAGQNSKEAFKAIGGGKFSTYQEVLNYYDYVSDVAQSKLEDLQQRMMEINSTSGTTGVHAGRNTFRDFMRDDRQSKLTDREDQRRYSSAENNAHTSSANKTIEPLVGKNVVSATLDEAKPLNIDTALQCLNNLDSKEAKKAYIAALPASIQSEVLNALKTAKQDEKARLSKLEDELEDLL